MKKATILVILFDFITLLIVIGVIYLLDWNHGYHMMWFMIVLAYFVAVMAYPPMAHIKLVRIEKIFSRVMQTCTLAIVIVTAYCLLTSTEDFHYNRILAGYLAAILLLFLDRLLAKTLLKKLRFLGYNSQKVVFVGAGHNLQYLYDLMSNDLSTGYRVVGYFDNKASQLLPDSLPLLGDINDVLPWLERNNVAQLYCNLPSSRSKEIVQIISYCEKHFIRFYSVPNVRNYVHRAMVVNMIDDMPVLTLMTEPLNDPVNRAVKRAFDIIISGLFIITCFWWIYLIVALITKITMPGPVFFRQKRNGMLGEEFYCFKFRSMKVNAQADTLQATKDDPRKTKWGNIMRKTNIDELPQFINVLLGDMSIVGPRPHMVKHTEEYSALIDKYMVRHWVKPGITGWAQVTGARGETEHLWQMENRIEKDIWYIENWSIWLDFRIIFLTIYNVLGGEKGNAY